MICFVKKIQITLLLAEAHSVRTTGSAALNLCNVAKGVVDVYWEVGCWEWDVAAGMVIVAESGGLVLGRS